MRLTGLGPDGILRNVLGAPMLQDKAHTAAGACDVTSIPSLFEDIDLSSGPAMASAAGDFACSVNSVVESFRDLRAELLQRGLGTDIHLFAHPLQSAGVSLMQSHAMIGSNIITSMETPQMEASYYHSMAAAATP